MKVVLSRKGFDSSNGGIVSPIFEDGTMISFPIPSDDSDRFSDLHYEGVSYLDILSDLHYKGGKFCHVDPDLDQVRRVTAIDKCKLIMCEKVNFRSTLFQILPFSAVNISQQTSDMEGIITGKTSFSRA